MTKMAGGCLSKLYLEIDHHAQRIDRAVLCLGDSNWIELTAIVTNGQGGFSIPMPFGCECTVTDITDRQWGNANYEVEFASSYSRDGVFWAKGFREVAGI
ncbi:hypothetical protein [Collimonas humicola]|jgi:hypothetical protein|uniref:hypothetical protein n=1 Tax=Collimonas humicola TaxID=2825886 RepID=UPI001B8B2246|nr:hypothetical protein [Collimonas humicola]